MKKSIQLLIIVSALSIVAVSCKSSQKCAAYGEVHRYKVERNF